jgi:hypothetical protein
MECVMRFWVRQQWWVSAAVFEDFSAAKSVEAFLRQRGFETRTYDDRLFRCFLFLRRPRITYRVQVRLSDSTRAANLLETEPPEVLQRVLRCPSCGSLRVSYPQMTRRFVLPTILLHVGIIFRFIDHECYCEKCHYVWHLPPKGRVVPQAAVPVPQAR